MSMYVFCTSTRGHNFTIWARPNGPRGIPIARKVIHIAGGANLASKALETPRGTMTVISDEDYALLQGLDAFKLRVKMGFISVEDAPASIDEVVSNMKAKDGCSPMVPEDFANAGVKPPTTSAKPPEAQSAINPSLRPVQDQPPTLEPETVVSESVGTDSLEKAIPGETDVPEPSETEKTEIVKPLKAAEPETEEVGPIDPVEKTNKPVRTRRIRKPTKE